MVKDRRRYRSLGALADAVVSGSPGAALHRPPRNGHLLQHRPPSPAVVRVLDIQQVPLTAPNSRRVSILVSDDEGDLLAMGLVGNLLGLRSQGPNAGDRIEEQVIELAESDVYRRGQRKWLTCPGMPNQPCGTKRMKLYLPPGEHVFACTRCHAIVVPHAPERPLRWRGESLRERVLHWREPLELRTARSA